MDRTVADLLARPVPDYVAPQPLLRQRFAESVVRRIRNAENPAAKRRAAVRLIATAGYPWWAGVLIDLLEGDDEALRREAQRALEDLAGEALGADASAWRRWRAGLDAGVVSPAL